MGETRTYLGLHAYEGAYRYRGMRIVPGWGGSRFEELMPDVFVPEAKWAPRSWRVNHPLHVRAQREHGLLEAGYGIWGFSPSSNPAGGYRQYGVDALGLNPEGYFSEQESTNVDDGFGTCRTGVNPTPTFGDGVATPHASFLAVLYEPRQAHANLQLLAELTPQGIPVTVSTDPRHSFFENAGASFTARGLPQWPEPIGLAALHDPELVRRFAEIVNAEYRALGIRAALHPTVDLATEPRWARIAGAFGQDPELVTELSLA